MTKPNLQIICRKDNIVTANNVMCFTMQLSADIQAPQPKIKWHQKAPGSACYIARPAEDGYIAVRAHNDGSICMSYFNKNVLVYVAHESNGDPETKYHIAHLLRLLETACTTNTTH